MAAERRAPVFPRPAERRQVEGAVRAEEYVEGALVRRVRVEDVAAVAKEDGEARWLTLRLDTARGFVQRDAEVIDEVAPERREPGEGPPQAPLARLDLRDRRAGDGGEGGVARGEVNDPAGELSVRCEQLPQSPSQAGSNGKA
jgi:hypothetical protein